MYRFKSINSKSLLSSLSTLTVVLGLAGCGQNPSFTESEAGPLEASNAGSGDATSDKGAIGSGVKYGPNGEELPGNLLAMSDSSIVKDQSKVDILWVVDSSGSMSEEQSYLGQNFSSFMSQLLVSGMDFQTGITSTDICSSTNPAQVPMAERYCPTLDGNSSSHLRGSLVGQSGFKVLKPGMSDISSRFLQYANVGTNGSSFEHGLKAAEMAVSKSLSGQNEGLVRPDAFLAVIVVSDEEDDGIGLGKTDVYTGTNYVAQGYTSARYTDTDLINSLNGTKGAGKFSVSTITGTKKPNGSMCTSAHSSPLEEGSQYIAAASKTGGIVQSICDTNWSASLSKIGQDIAGQSSQIQLSKIPYDGLIKVTVNGDLTTQWTFSSGNNSVKFNSGFVPASGSEVKVSYFYAP